MSLLLEIGIYEIFYRKVGDNIGQSSLIFISKSSTAHTNQEQTIADQSNISDIKFVHLL